MLIAFDLDGTLIDSSRDLAEAANELVGSFGGRPLGVGDVVAMVGDGAPMLVRRALSRSGLDPKTPGALSTFLQIYDRRLLDHTVPYEGITEVLALAQRFGPLAVLTNKPLAPSRAILEALGLGGHFVDVIGGDGPYVRKPDPDGLRALVHRWSAGRGPVVLVGDSPADAATAVAADAEFVWARYGFGAGKFDASHAPRRAADHPRELVGLLATLATPESQ